MKIDGPFKKVLGYRFKLYGLAALLLVLWFFYRTISAFYVPCYLGVDENGYMLLAKGIATKMDGRKTIENPYQYVSENIVMIGDNLYHPKYPTGFPLVVAIFSKLFGYEASYWVNPLFGLLSLAGIVLMGRAMHNGMTGILAAMILAVNPLYVMFSLSALSHSGSICCSIWGMYFTWMWCHKGGLWRAILAGGITAYAMSIRYTEGLLLLPMGVLVCWRAHRLWKSMESPSIRPWIRQILPDLAVMFVAAVVAVIPLLVSNHTAYGNPFTSGYALCRETSGFGWKYMTRNWDLMLERMSQNLFLIFPIGLASLIWLSFRERWKSAFLTMWSVPGILLYTSYYWAPESDNRGYIRFFLSYFPPLILGALILLRTGTTSSKIRRIFIPGGFILLLCIFNLRGMVDQISRQMSRANICLLIKDILDIRLPPGSTLFAENIYLNFLEYATDYHYYDLRMGTDYGVNHFFQKFPDDGDIHPFQTKKIRLFKKLYGGKPEWQLANIQRRMINEELKKGRRVAVVLGERLAYQLKDRFENHFRIKLLGNAEDIPDREGWRWDGSGPPAARLAVYELIANPEAAPPPKPKKQVPKEPPPEEEQYIKEKIRLDELRAEFEQKYPGAFDEQKGIRQQNGVVRELIKKIPPERVKALDEELLKRKSQPPPPPPPPPEPPPPPQPEGDSKSIPDKTDQPDPPPLTTTNSPVPVTAPPQGETREAPVPLENLKQEIEKKEPTSQNEAPVPPSDKPSVPPEENQKTEPASPNP